MNNLMLSFQNVLYGTAVDFEALKYSITIFLRLHKYLAA